MRHDTPVDRLPPTMPDFLSEADCADLMRRVVSFTRGGGDTELWVQTAWIGNVRWARNLVSSSSDLRSNIIELFRNIRGASQGFAINQLNDAALQDAVRVVEHLLMTTRERFESDLIDDYQEPISHPEVWFDTTYHLDAEHRADVARAAIEPVAAAGMLSAGYLEVRAAGVANWNSRKARHPLYMPYTTAQFSLTVRDPQGTGSGWAGVDWSDWTKIDTAHLSAVALDKCLRSRNPVALEPGRYTAILEPQAVGDLMGALINSAAVDRLSTEGGKGPFAGDTIGATKIGQKVLDERITIVSDPMDPDIAFPPFDVRGYDVFNRLVYVEDGILRNLEYQRNPYGIQTLGLNSGLLGIGAFHMTGGFTPIADMIQTTKRGLLVTRFSDVRQIDLKSMLCSGYTRDGLWLVENGQITKAVKNFRFTESPLIVFNQVEQLGVPQRIFHPGAPVAAPPAKVRDFSFTSIADAV